MVTRMKGRLRLHDVALRLLQGVSYIYLRMYRMPGRGMEIRLEREEILKKDA